MAARRSPQCPRCNQTIQDNGEPRTSRRRPFLGQPVIGGEARNHDRLPFASTPAQTTPTPDSRVPRCSERLRSIGPCLNPPSPPPRPTLPPRSTRRPNSMAKTTRDQLISIARKLDIPVNGEPPTLEALMPLLPQPWSMAVNAEESAWTGVICYRIFFDDPDGLGGYAFTSDSPVLAALHVIYYARFKDDILHARKSADPLR